MRIRRPDRCCLVNPLTGAIGEVRIQVKRHWHSTNVVYPRRVAITRFIDAREREIDVVIAEEPAIPEPVQVLTGDVVEGVEEIPGNGVLAVPAIHELVQRATECRVSEEILEREVADRGLAVRV